jgi:hypothetical protein
MLTFLHVVCGTIALVVAPAAILARKGGAWHRRWGTGFLIAMAVVLFTAGFLWQAHGHLFLLPLAAVSAYLLFNGRRVIVRRRRSRPDEIEDRIDVVAACAAMVAGAAVLYLGVAAPNALLLTLRPALIGIGTIAIAFACNDILGFSARRTKTGWLLSHFAAMIAAYVSAVTAFVVINEHSVPMILRWLVPSAIGAALIVGYTLRRVRVFETTAEHLPGIPSAAWSALVRRLRRATGLTRGVLTRRPDP